MDESHPGSSQWCVPQEEERCPPEDVSAWIPLSRSSVDSGQPDVFRLRQSHRWESHSSTIGH